MTEEKPITVVRLADAYRKLADELASAQASARQAADRNRETIASLREALARSQQAAEDKAAQTYEKMQEIFASVQVPPPPQVHSAAAAMSR